MQIVFGIEVSSLVFYFLLILQPLLFPDKPKWEFPMQDSSYLRNLMSTAQGFSAKFESYSLVAWKVKETIRHDILKGRQTKAHGIAVNSRKDTG